MRPISIVLLGTAVVVLDVRVGGFDLLHDAVGYLLMIIGYGKLADRHVGFAAAVVATIAGAIAALAISVWPDQPAWQVVDLIATTVALFGTCTALIALVPDRSVATQANVIRWLDVGLALISLWLSLQWPDRREPILALVVMVPGVLIVFGWFVVLLWLNRGRPELATDRAAVG